MSAETLEDKITLSSIARSALRSADGDVAEATKSLTGRLHRDKTLLRLLVSDAIEVAASEAVRHNMRQERIRVMARVGAFASMDGPAAVRALAAGLAASILDYPLSSGIRLRDASAEQVTEQADRYESIGRDVNRKAKFLRLVAQSVPRGTTVGQVISDDRANEIWREAA